MDDSFQAENNTIASIKRLICDFYAGRETELSRSGLTALGNTMAGIYYIPFKCGCSLIFSYSGQSIPNRLDVKKDLGVKIYFDHIETEARVAQVCQKVRELFADGEAVLQSFKPNAAEQLVWHVAAHEVGHAIYGISNMAEYVPKEYVTLLEEPRAELTAMFTLRRLFEQKVITEENLQHYLVHFAMDALRYFAKFDSQALQPYIIFQIYAYKTYEKHGFLKLGATGKLSLDASRTLPVLDEFSAAFLEILDCCDMANAAGGSRLVAMTDGMRQTTPFVDALVAMCRP